MATRTTPDIEILVGVEGGGSISGASGVKIRNQLTNIISNINKQQATQLRLKVDQQYIQNQIANAIKIMPPVDLNVKVNPNGGGSGGGSTGGNSAVNQIQKIGSMVAQINQKKIKLLDVSATSKEAQEISSQISSLWKKVASEAKAYAKSSGKTPTEIKNQVYALNSVTKSADAYNIKVKRINDTYDVLKSKVIDFKTAADAAYKTNASKNATVPEQWAEYNQLYGEFVTKVNQVAGGKFNTLDSHEQIKQLKDIVNLYGKVEQALKKVQVADKQYSNVAEKSRTREKNGILSVQKYTSQIYDFYEKIKNTAPKSFSDDVLNLFNQAASGQYGSNIKGLIDDFTRYENAAYAAGYATEDFGHKITRIFKEKFGYGVMAAFAMQARRALRQVYTNVVDIDTAMTELKKVTNETAATYRAFLDDASKRAKSLGATLADTVTATADFARLGYSLEDASRLADSALVYKNVGDGIDSINDASESVISTMKAFNVEAENSMTIVDKFNEVGNNFAISSKGVGDALLNSASALASANNDLDQSIALIAAANSVVQDPEKVGTALKTVSMYLRAAKSEAEDAGESTDGMAESVSELQKQLLALTGNKVNIMLDSKNFKSTYQILKELASVWGQLSDVTQANILEKIGGKRNANVVSAILNNFTIAEEALATAQNSAGSALKENEKYLDSINGKIATMQASFQKLSSNILDSSIVKGFYTVITGVIDALNWINDATGGLVSNLAVVGVAIMAVVVAFNILKASAMNGVLASIGRMIGSLGELIQSFFLTAGGANAAGAAIGTLNTAMLGWVGIAAVAVIGAYQLYQAYSNAEESVEQLTEKFETLQSEISGLQDELDQNNDRIKELQQLSDSGSINFVEEDELKRLREANDLLEKQIQLKQKDAKDAQSKIIAQNLVTLNGGAEGPRGMTTYDEDGTVYEGMSRMDAFYADLDAYKNAKSRYQEAVTSGDENWAAKEKKLLDNLSNSIDGQISKMVDLTSVMDAANSPEEAAAIKMVREAWDSYKLTIGGVTVAQEVFNDIIGRTEYESAITAIKELGDQGLLTKEALIELYKTNPQVRALFDYLASQGLISLGDLSTFVNQFNIAASKASSSILTLSAAIQKIEGPVSVLNKAFKETSEDGYVSIDTLEELTSKYPALQKYLVQTASGYKLTKEALQDYLDAQASEYKVAVGTAQNAAIQVLSNEGVKSTAYAHTTEEIKKQLKAVIALNNVTIATEQADMLSKYGNDAIGRKLATENKTAELKKAEAAVSAAAKALADLDAAQNNLDMYNRIADSVQRDANNAVSSGSSSDKYKQAVEKEIKILQHKREMDLITDEEYYNQLEAIENKYYKDSAAHREKYKEEIWDLDQEIFNGRRDILSDWISDQEKIAEGFNLGGDLNSQKKVYEEILNEVEKMIDSAIKYGLDENSDYVQELRDQYHKTCQDILSMVQDAYDSFKSYADDFEMWDSFDFTKIEFLEKNLEEIKKLYQEGTLGWKEYVEAYNEVAKELYDTKKESIETIIDMTMEMIEQEANDEIDALDDQIDKLNEIIDLKKKLLQDTKDEKDHEKQVAEAVSEIAKLQSKIAQLSLDDSREAIAKRADLEEQLAEKQKELADLQGDYALDKTLDVLDETKEAKEDEAEAEKKAIEKSIDSWVKKYKLAIDRIDNDWDNLYDDLNDWMAEHRDSIDGPDSLKTAWENVDQMVRQTGQDIESIYNGNGNIGINPDATTSSSAQAILDKMQANSAYALLNPGSGLSTTNAKLADDYYKATGRKLYYNDSVGWVFDSKTSTNAAYEILGSKAKSNPYTAGTAQYGEKNSEAVKWIQAQLKAIGYKDQSIDGNYWQTTAKNVAAFAAKHHIASDGKRVTPQILKYLKAYHNGGIVDRTGAINDKEVLSILETGEIVLDDKKKATLSSIFGGIKASLSAMTRVSTMPYQRRVAAVGGYGDTFAPQVSVNISHNGKMTDRDAKRYGDIAADATLEKLRAAFNKRGVS